MPAIPVANEAEWHAIREMHVGGSEIACLFQQWLIDGKKVVRHIYEPVPADAVPLGSLSPYKTGYRLFMEKAGIVMPENFGGDRIEAGTFLEPALAAWAKARWDWPLRKVRRYMKHPTVEGWGSSLDYESHEAGMPPVEFKNVDKWIFDREWLLDDDDTIAVPPLHIILQLQAQIGVSEANHGWTVACVGGNSIYRGRIERHEPTQQRIGEAIAVFWQNVKAGNPPNEVADMETVAQAYAYGDKGTTKDLTQAEGLPAHCRRYLRWKAHLDKVESVVSVLKGRIAERIGEADKAVANGFNLTWPVINREEKMQPAKVLPALSYRGALYVTQQKPPKPKKTKAAATAAS